MGLGEESSVAPVAEVAIASLEGEAEESTPETAGVGCASTEDEEVTGSTNADTGATTCGADTGKESPWGTIGGGAV